MSIQAKRHLFLGKSLGLLSVILCTSFASADLYRHYKLDDGEGDTVFDSSPNAVHGEIFDAEWTMDDDRGMVLEFDGEISSVDGGFLPLMDLENDFTWAFWENQDDVQNSPANDIILGNRVGEDGVDTSPREFIKFTPNRFEYHMNGGFANDMPYGADDPEHIFSDGEWRHHVVVKEAESLSYYRDGELFNEHELIDPMFSEDPLPIWLGGQFGLGAGEHWAGRLSDVQLYDQALTADEVNTVMGGGVIGGGEPCDLNGDGICDVGDIDDIAAAIRAGSADGKYDLNNDGSVDDADRTALIKEPAPFFHSWIGDSDLNGEFNSGDFVKVFGAAKYETGQSAGWGDGDWNGDGEFNSSDFVAAFVDGGYEKGPVAPVANVPEPSTAVLFLIGLTALLRQRR